MVVIAVDYARNDCQHPTAAKRSEQPQDCVPGLSGWLDNLRRFCKIQKAVELAAGQGR
jgi:hypothetical protein